MPYKFKAGTKGANFRGKYCTLCNSVWEFVPSVGVIRHPDFPSYGLERENCSRCGGVSTEAKSPPTLAEKAAGQRKNLFKKDKELQRLSLEAEKLQDKIVAKLQGLDEPDYEQLAKVLEAKYNPD